MVKPVELHGCFRNDVEAQQALVRQTITWASRRVSIAGEV